jgi:hypothetical protein
MNPSLFNKIVDRTDYKNAKLKSVHPILDNICKKTNNMKSKIHCQELINILKDHIHSNDDSKIIQNHHIYHISELLKEEQKNIISSFEQTSGSHLD